LAAALVERRQLGLESIFNLPRVGFSQAVLGAKDPVRCGVAVSLTAQTGQSEAIHSPEECASTVVRLTIPAVWLIAVVCTVAISCWPSITVVIFV
jgi:hypothetical protein